MPVDTFKTFMGESCLLPPNFSYSCQKWLFTVISRFFYPQLLFLSCLLISALLKRVSRKSIAVEKNGVLNLHCLALPLIVDVPGGLVCWQIFNKGSFSGRHDGVFLKSGSRPVCNSSQNSLPNTRVETCISLNFVIRTNYWNKNLGPELKSTLARGDPKMLPPARERSQTFWQIPN